MDPRIKAFESHIKSILRRQLQISSEDSCKITKSLLEHGLHFFKTCPSFINHPVRDGAEQHAVLVIEQLMERYEQVKSACPGIDTLHIFLHSVKIDGAIRRRQFQQYAELSPQITFSRSFDDDSSNTAGVDVDTEEALWVSLNESLFKSGRTGAKTLYMVFNFHGLLDGSIQLTDSCSVRMDDIILRVKEKVQSLCEGPQRAHRYPEVCLIFAQCYGHVFDKAAASDGDYISNIYWFTSEQFPTTNNLPNGAGEPEHLQLMNFARDPCHQQNLKSWKDAEESDKMHQEMEELRRKNEMLEQMLATMTTREDERQAAGGQAALLPSGTSTAQVVREASGIGQQARDGGDRRSLTSTDGLIEDDDCDKKERGKAKPKTGSLKGSNFPGNILVEGISVKSDSLKSNLLEHPHGLGEPSKHRNKSSLCCWKIHADEEF